MTSSSPDTPRTDITAAQIQATLVQRPVRHLIGGQLVDSGQTFSVIHPGTGAVCAPCVEATRADLDHLLSKTRRCVSELAVRLFGS